MESKTSFLFDLAENVIGIFNKLFNLFFILAVFISLSEIQHNKTLYASAMIIYVLSVYYIVYSSYCLYATKGLKFEIKNFIRNLREHIREFFGFILCIFLSMLLLSLTFSATVILNLLSLNS